jgi:hypothetical protein
MIWLYVAHVLSWFFIWWAAKVLILITTKKAASNALFWNALIMGTISFILHYALSKVAAVPLTV